MKKNILLLAVLPMMLLLAGCPYNSKVPLSSAPKTPIDKSLLGEWKDMESKEPNDSSTFQIYEFNKSEYGIVILDKTNNTVKVDAYRAFITPVAGKMLMTLEDLKHKGEYNFFSYSIEGDVLKIKVVSDVSVKDKYDSPKSLVKAFAKKINDKDFFESELVFVRSK